MSAPNETGRGGKFTPGPWQITFGKTLLHIETTNIENAPPEWEAGIAVCSVPKSKMENAKLIAAAPELLEACQGLMMLVEDIDHKDAVSSNFPAYQKAKAAIQLATE